MQTLFQKNLKYFYYNIPDYYKLITNIKTRRFKIQNQNIFDTETNSYLYPIQENKSQLYSISEIYSLSPINNKLWKKHFSTYKLYEHSEDRLYITSNIINKIHSTAKESENFNENGYYFDKSFLPATTIFGILSGLHIEYLVKNYNFQSLFIYEPEPEFFAISCYFIDYEYLYNKLGDKVFIFIKGNLDETIIKKFYEERIITANFLRIEFTTYENPKINDAKEKFKLANTSNKRGWGSYEDEIIGIKNHINNIKLNIPILKSSKQYKTPICVVANGSSLENSLKFIKENQDNFIIISVGTATKPLLNAGIMSDFHIEIERMPYLVDVLKEFLPNYKGYFVGATVIDSENFSLNPNSIMFIRDASSISNQGYSLKYASPVVGNAGVSFASHFSDEIYLCGFDAGFKKNEKLHATGSFYDDKDDKSNEAFKVRGNLSNNIYSNALLNLSRMSLANGIKKLNVKVYNLSDGAFIPNTIPTKQENLKLKKIDKKKGIKRILKHFSNHKNKELNYQKDLEIYIKTIQKFLERTPKNREQLTNLIDSITDYTLFVYNKEPVVGTLMRGSIWHLINNLYISLHKIDIKEYQKLAKIVIVELEKYKS